VQNLVDGGGLAGNWQLRKKMWVKSKIFLDFKSFRKIVKLSRRTRLTHHIRIGGKIKTEQNNTIKTKTYLEPANWWIQQLQWRKRPQQKQC